jgi:hypothetical protein
MRLSPIERILAVACVLSAVYRYVTGQWPVGIEVEE